MLRSILAFCVILATSEAARAQATVAPKPKRVLVYTVSAGFEHDVVKRATPDAPSLVERALVELGKQRGWFECVLSREASDFTKEKLASFDLVFFYTTGELPFAPENQRALLDFVKDGKAFAGAHCATDTFYELPEYGEMVGAYFDGHPWHEKVRVLVDDREHPSTRHLGASFEITDEIYQFKAPYERSKLHVLLHLDPDATDLKKEGVHRTDRDFANAWCKEVGKGRLFYTALGHRPEVWADERFLKHLEGGFAWAMHAEKQAGFDGAGDAATKPSAPAPKGGAPAPDPGSAPNQAPTLAVPSGFAVDLVAQSPQILWPTAVACLDDGTLLVGEDRMDMPGPTDQPLDRLIALHFKPDGSFEKTVFADKLFAVMGVELVDDAVYVMNMPHLTRLRDTNGDGVADERTEVLSDLGPPAPGFPGGFNDHIVSGVRLGLDGFLYISVGDKGIPHAHGTDGSELTLRGGGVIRVRPDGSRLEIVATGLRNVLDVAMDDRGEMFTYDNTDDGLGWWTRLTHIVPGGYYGYPWDYKEHPERMLPCMAEYGGGSPCGGLVYREAAWPEEFRGNLFYCEWGKGMLRRFVLEPKGATFGVQLADDFVTAGSVTPFKPFDVCESPDGRFLYISDWAYEGWTAKVEAGRIWRLRRADDDARVPSRMRELASDATQLGQDLADPSFRQRMRAQRALAKRGMEALDIAKPIAGDSRGSLAQRHAIWVVAEAWRYPEPWRVDFRSQPHSVDGWIQLCRADTAYPEHVDVDLAGLLMEMQPAWCAEAATAAAERIARTRGAPPPRATKRMGPAPSDLTMLRSFACAPGSDAWGRFRALRALRRAGLTSWSETLERKYESEVLASMRDRCETGVVDALVQRFSDVTSGHNRAAVLDTLASCARKEAPWDGKWWNIQPAKTPRPRRTIDWEGTASVINVVRAALKDPDVSVRRTALTAVRDMDDRDALPGVRNKAEHDSDVATRTLAVDVLGAMKDEGAAPVLESIVRDAARGAEERRHAVEAACAIRSPAMLALLRSVACDERADPAHSIVCIEALARLRDVESVPELARRARSGQNELRAAAMSALARIQGRNAGAVLAEQLGDPAKDVRNAACRALAVAGDVNQVPALIPLANAPDTAVEARLALARMPDVRALSVFLDGVRSSEKRVVDASQAALLALRDEARVELEALYKVGKLDEKQLAAVQQALRAPQPVTRWNVLGPFDRIGEHPLVLVRGPDRGSRLSTIDSEHPNLAARYIGREQAEFSWREVRADTRTGFVDLREVFQGFDEVSAFAFARVSSTTRRKAQLLLGSDDMAKVWLNGARVHDFGGYRAWTEDEDKFEIELQPGDNALLVEIDNGGGGWSFNAKISGDASGPLFERASSAPGVDDYRDFAIEHPGDAQHGYKLFRLPSGPMCIRCHTVFGEGAQVGPDLSDVAAKYGRDEILQSILTPSQRIAEGYNSIAFELTNGLVTFGQIKRETADTIEIYDTNGELKKLEKSDVESRTVSKTSVMPDGLAALMSKEDFADLFAYVLTLRGAGK